MADRLKNLGTETAFAVSSESAEMARRGKKIYPFHIGDVNLKTPENIVQATIEAIRSGKTGYCSNYGLEELRDLLAKEINKTRGTRFGLENVAVQPGGKPVIGKFLLTLMNPGDEVLYPNPGFPIYESLIRFYGGVAVPYGFREGKQNYELKIENIEKSITPKTRIMIFNNLHNPTGAESTETELAELTALIERHNLDVLCDEAYFDIRYSGASRSLLSFPGMSERCVILYTFSKKYAMTGWRIGAAIGPKKVIDKIATLNVNHESCTNHFVQYGAIEALSGSQEGYRRIISVLEQRRNAAVEILGSTRGIRCFTPDVTFYLFPNVSEALKRKGVTDYEQFRAMSLEETGVSFCTRLHFGSPMPGEEDYYVRFAYSGIEVDQIREGLSKFKELIER
ncbi:MAG TPA: aminotransferase class I/II-fold pyridoxal phosphate-dependent enzyme [Spirochaetia bacterium]|nr:aminotransferase class I/II-fold pyridoxal phosphate-dependent enzyme [Spirochaetia bacterium]